MKISYLSLLPLTVFLIALLSLSFSLADKVRETMVASLAPSWSSLVNAKIALINISKSSFKVVEEQVTTKEEEIQRPLLENQLLKNEIAYLKETLIQETAVFQQILLEPLNKEKGAGILSHSLLKQQQMLENIFQLELLAIPARIIFRGLDCWSSAFWVNVGEEDNQKLGRIVIAKNSPVVLGTAIVGVVDYVGQKQTKIRLITDANLNLAVRIKRGSKLLAKGELKGESLPLFRSQRPLLQGTGFNYDFADEEGPARHLHTGEEWGNEQNSISIPLLQVNDSLISTGMDGVFPPGLQAGIVKRILPLKEGDYYYTLEAEPAVTNLNNLSLVFILPPLGYDSKIQPPLY